METNDKVKVFDKEISLINDSNIKKLTKEVLKNADDWFFIEPASSSGKYHPDFAREVGGLVKHTKAVVYFLKEMYRSELYDIDTHHFDLLILSAIAHDIKKYGEGNNTGHTVKNHPELASNYIKFINDGKKGGYINENDLKYVQQCVLTHMGVFGDIKPSTDDEKLLHLADLIASRKEIDLKFEKNVEKAILPTVDDFVIDFGMHNGKLIKDVPIDYLKWAVENVTKKPIFLKLAKKILTEEKNKKNEDSK